MEFVFAYLAGLLTLINPCVLPVLPVVLSGALHTNRLGPLALAAGMSLSFVVLGVSVSAFGYAVGLTPAMVADAGAVLLVIFGLVMFVPAAQRRFAMATSGVAAGADATLGGFDQTHLRGQFLGGLLLGAVWSPCIGPTLGSAIALASQGTNLGFASYIMLGYALGVSTLIIGIGYGAQGLINRNRAAIMRIATAAPKIMGVVFVLVGLFLLFRLNHYVEGWLLDMMPDWLIDLSYSI